jgi:hypothetical protein
MSFSRIALTRGQSVLDVLEEDDLLISGRLSEGDDMNAIKRLGMHQRHANAFQEAERDKALFIIAKPIVLERECRASKDFLRIDKIKAVLLEIVSSLGVAPRKSHAESVYTYRLFVKGMVENGLTPAVSGRRPNETLQIQQHPHAGGGHEHGMVRQCNPVG